MTKMTNQRILKILHATSLNLATVLGLILSQNSFANSTLIIAQSNGIVPGGNGQFLSLFEPKINTSNNVIFSARLFNTTGNNTDDSAIYRTFVPVTNNPQVVTLEEVVREDEFFTASGRSFHLSDLLISSSSLITNAPVGGSPATGEFSNLALMLPLVTNSGDLGDSIIVVESAGAFKLVAEAGATVESLNGEYAEFNALSLVGLNANNQLTFFSAIDNSENGSQDNTAYFKRYNNDTVDEIARKGDSASSGVITHPAGMVTNDYGEGVFSGLNDSDDSNNNSGLYKSSGSSYSIAVHEGDSAPSAESASHHFTQLQSARINNQQEIGFIGTVRDENGFAVPNGTGLFLSGNDSIKAILLQGQTTPDGTATFLNLVNYIRVLPNLTMNDLAQFALRVGLVGDLTLEVGQGDGIFRASETEVAELARKGDAYEDGNLRNFSNPVINNHGLVVFEADLQLKEAVETDEGDFFPLDDILIISDGIHFETIARAGQDYNGKIIREIFFNNSPNGVANGLSDSGTVVYKVDYEDGTDGIHAWIPDFGWRVEGAQGEWDDVTNWHFGGLPNQFSDVILDLEQDLDLQGPAQPTTIKSMSLGGDTGVVHLTLKDSILTINEGLMIHSASILSGQGTLESAVQNNGRIEMLEDQSLTISGETSNNGAVLLHEASELRFLSLFKGNETIQGTGTVTFNGALQLGDEPELLIIEGNLNFDEVNILQIKVAGLERGESYDALDVGGTVSLGGTLDLQLSETLSFKNGDTFELLQGNQISGEFDHIILPNLPSQGLTLSINKTAAKIELIVTEDNASQDNNDEPNLETSSGGGSINLLFFISLLIIIIRVTDGKSKRSTL